MIREEYGLGSASEDNQEDEEKNNEEDDDNVDEEKNKLHRETSIYGDFVDATEE